MRTQNIHIIIIVILILNFSWNCKPLQLNLLNISSSPGCLQYKICVLTERMFADWEKLGPCWPPVLVVRWRGEDIALAWQTITVIPGIFIKQSHSLLSVWQNCIKAPAPSRPGPAKNCKLSEFGGDWVLRSCSVVVVVAASCRGERLDWKLSLSAVTHRPTGEQSHHHHHLQSPLPSEPSACTQ